jgi:hypothetical protein
LDFLWEIVSRFLCVSMIRRNLGHPVVGPGGDMEWAPCLIVVLRLAWRIGHTPENIQLQIGAREDT